MSDWSFRRDVGPFILKRSDGSLHLRDVVSFLKGTPPDDVPPSLFISFTNLLFV